MHWNTVGLVIDWFFFLGAMKDKEGAEKRVWKTALYNCRILADSFSRQNNLCAFKKKTLLKKKNYSE